MTGGERLFCEFQYGMTGSFFTALFDAMLKADSENLARLILGFPEEVNAVIKYKHEDGYWQKLDEEYCMERVRSL